MAKARSASKARIVLMGILLTDHPSIARQHGRNPSCEDGTVTRIGRLGQASHLRLRQVCVQVLTSGECREVRAYTTNMATPAANIAKVVMATTVHPRRELGWPCINFLSAATMRMATRRNGASNPLMTAVQ